MDSQMTERPVIHWVEVPTIDGGTHLEMRWVTDSPLVAHAGTHAA